jgi:hypothetical protein
MVFFLAALHLFLVLLQVQIPKSDCAVVPFFCFVFRDYLRPLVGLGPIESVERRRIIATV